ncbi:acid sphingomyelinase-like phosphodiesterase 3b [Haliotis rubra]|uniref:acid sphingomyelinase-like phosphodiesterase 3b n=1 Tax=Haliotis rubra TaxID=36100 RepID=UPI001EE62785|nr:acid sphingomyelinase-like phosphodiesterase 3b [Haliotis rubra]
MAAVNGWLGTLVILLIISASKAQEGYFWHITDHHYDTTYWSEMRSCNDEVPVRGIYGDYWCDSPWRLVNDSINAMASIKSNVDFIIWTGDTVAHIKDQYLNESVNLEIMKVVTDALKAAFPGVKVYATMGNHDWYPSDQFPVTSHFLYNATAELWEDWIGDAEQMANFRKGAYYTAKTAQGLRIIGLNTNLYYTSDKLTTDLTDPAGQFAWLEEVLKNAKVAGEKVRCCYPLTFLPAFTFLEMFNGWLSISTPASSTYSNNIPTSSPPCSSGTTTLTDSNYYKNGSTPGTPMFMAPSITPWRYKIPGKSGDAHNPAIRLVKYNKGSGLLLDIHQYYMDLTDSNKNNASNWTIAYKTSEAFGLSDLSADSLNGVIKKMETDKTLLDKYIKYNTVLANGEKTVNECGEKCRAIFTCGFTHMDKTSFDSCVDFRVGAATMLRSTTTFFIALATLYILM